MILIIGGSYQGKTEYALTNFPKARFSNQAHLFIKKRLEEGKSEADILAEMREMVADGDWVIISDDIGNGVVPLDKTDRQWREICGRVLIEIAKEATEVHRVILGIGQRIK
jgi:adenosylcobinamide kinase/adenosylcobinamide-phosphate guanylyltransferase